MIAPMTVKALALIRLVAIVAGKQQPNQPNSAQETFNSLDKDASGFVEVPEIIAFAAKEGMTDSNAVIAEFQSLDRDGDGKLNASELEGMLSLADGADGSSASADMNSRPVNAPVPQETPNAPALEMLNAPAMDVPKLDFEMPNLDVEVPSLNMLNMPKLDIPSLEAIDPKLRMNMRNALPPPALAPKVESAASQAALLAFPRPRLEKTAATQPQNLRAASKALKRLRVPVQLLQQQQKKQQPAVSSTAQQTLAALDTDGSGWVEPGEIEAFAKSQGLADSMSVLAEFQTADRDGNGKLDASELERMLSTSEDSAPAEPASPPGEAPPQPAAGEPQPLDVETPVGAAPVADQSELRSLGRRAQAGSLPVEAVPLGEPAPPQQQEVQLPAPLPQEHAQPQQQEVQLQAPVPQAAAPAEQPPAHVSDNATSWLQRSAGKSEKMAARAAAELFARQAQQVLAQRGAEEKQAGELEALAKHLRRQEEEVVSSAAEAARDASSKAVEGVMKVNLGKIKEMETRLHATEARAAEKHKLAEEAMARALKSQSDLTVAMRRIRGGSASVVRQ